MEEENSDQNLPEENKPAPKSLTIIILVIIVFLLGLFFIATRRGTFPGSRFFGQYANPSPTTGAQETVQSATAPTGKNPFGVSVDHRIPIATRLSVAKNLGVPYYRNTAVIAGDGVTYAVEPKPIIDAGFQVVLNVRNFDSFNPQSLQKGSINEVEVFPKDLNKYKSAVAKAIDEIKPALIVVGNEAATTQHTSMTAQQYQQMLNAACEVSHSKNVPCATDGTLSGTVNIYTYYYYYYLQNNPQKAESFKQGGFEQFQMNLTADKIKERLETNQKGLAQGSFLSWMDVYKNSAADYINIHWYSKPNAVPQANAEAFTEAAQVFQTVTGKPVITNETGLRDLNTQTLTDRMQKALDLKMPFFIYYSSGAGPAGPKALQDGNGSLNALGEAFKTFLQQHFP